jgi:hypothetical protein
MKGYTPVMDTVSRLKIADARPRTAQGLEDATLACKHL